MIRCVKSIPGVREVVDRLERTSRRARSRRCRPRRSSARAGCGPRRCRSARSARARCSPDTGCSRAATRRQAARGRRRCARSLRGAVNEPLPKLVSHRAEVMVQKTIVVHAPIHKVFDLWSQLDNFPQFMHHVRDIDLQLGGNRSMWTVDGPAGTAVDFEAETIELEPDRVIAWRTRAGPADRARGSRAVRRAARRGDPRHRPHDVPAAGRRARSRDRAHPRLGSEVAHRR